ncbi:Cyclopentanol dehydrogenase [Clostridium perfringens]|nr:SDR family NAD(P)-dependent oxidoreductase [Clostridium perfringens]MDH5067021.1 Cyclopentanol dehydrogenase [Clostridium perfringens]
MSKIIDGRFSDKVMIITGAAGGIGKAVALRAAKEGAKLVLADRKEEMSKETLKEIREITSNVEFLICDLREGENCKKVIDTAIKKIWWLRYFNK